MDFYWKLFCKESIYVFGVPIVGLDIDVRQIAEGITVMLHLLFCQRNGLYMMQIHWIVVLFCVLLGS